MVMIQIADSQHSKPRSKHLHIYIYTCMYDIHVNDAVNDVCLKSDSLSPGNETSMKPPTRSTVGSVVFAKRL